MGPWTRWPQGSSTFDILWHSRHLREVPLPSRKSSQSSELENLAVCRHAAWKPHPLARVPLTVTVSKTGLGSTCKWCTYTWQGASESGRHVLLCGYLTPSSDLAHAPALSGHKQKFKRKERTIRLLPAFLNKYATPCNYAPLGPEHSAETFEEWADTCHKAVSHAALAVQGLPKSDDTLSTASDSLASDCPAEFEENLLENVTMQLLLFPHLPTPVQWKGLSNK